MMIHVSLPTGKICSVDNGGCSHVCADEAKGARCACPVGYELSTNWTDCQGVCVSVSKSITILISRGFHLESNFDEPNISFCLGVVSQFGINKVHIYLLLPSVWKVNMTF